MFLAGAGSIDLLLEQHPELGPLKAAGAPSFSFDKKKAKISGAFKFAATVALRFGDWLGLSLKRLAASISGFPPKSASQV